MNNDEIEIQKSLEMTNLKNNLFNWFFNWFFKWREIISIKGIDPCQTKAPYFCELMARN